MLIDVSPDSVCSRIRDGDVIYAMHFFCELFRLRFLSLNLKPARESDNAVLHCYDKPTAVWDVYRDIHPYLVGNDP